MRRVYEIFEVPPNGSPQKVTVVLGLEYAKSVLQGLANHTTNECFASDTKTHQIVMQLNAPSAKLRRVFQITYDEAVGLRRAELLRSQGYGVVSVIGNEEAKLLLTCTQPYDLFIVGHAASVETRRELVGWLKALYPQVKILAVNSPDQQVAAADFNVLLNGPETWLPIVSKVCERRSSPRGA